MSCCNQPALRRVRRPRLDGGDISTPDRAVINATVTVRQGDTELLIEIEAAMTDAQMMALVERIRGHR